MNKKGMAMSTLGKLILVFIVVFILILLYNRTMRGGTKILECTTNGGKCVKDTCDFATQIPMLSDKAAGCEKGEICCVNIQRDKPPADPKCLNKTLGYKCGNNSYCDFGSQCISKCEFCAINWGTDEVKQLNPVVCQKNFDYTGFSCKCTKADYDKKVANDTTKTTYIGLHCTQSNPLATDYACCK